MRSTHFSLSSEALGGLPPCSRAEDARRETGCSISARERAGVSNEARDTIGAGTLERSAVPSCTELQCPHAPCSLCDDFDASRSGQQSCAPLDPDGV